jgi:general secretion pathway protein L
MHAHLHLPQWWVDAMVDGVATLADDVLARRRFRLVPEAEGYRIDGPGRRERIRSALFGAGERAGARDEAVRLKGQHIDVVLRSEEVLVRTLDPLPPQSRPYLQDIIRHNLETLIPWRLSDVYYGYFVAPAQTNKQQLLVTVVATARSVHSELMSRLNELQARSVRFLYVDPAVATGALAIASDNPGSDRVRRARLAKWVNIVATAAVLGVAAATALLFLAHRGLEAEHARIDTAISEAQRALDASGGASGSGASAEAERLVAQKRKAPVLVLALDALSAALPDDTSLTELRIADGRVHITGVSQNVGALIPLLDASHGFADARFFAPTTRLPDGRSDQFHVEFQLLPARKGGP